MKLMIMFVFSLGISSCVSFSGFDYPDEFKGFYLNGRNAKPNTLFAEKVQRDMLSCGFKNTSNNSGYMTKTETIKANFCMEEKGYTLGYIGNKHANTICDFEIYKYESLCRNRHT